MTNTSSSSIASTYSGYPSLSASGTLLGLWSRYDPLARPHFSFLVYLFTTDRLTCVLFTPFRMENNTLSNATAATQPRLYGIVQTYIQKQLPRNIHPAFKALRDREEATTTLPQIGFTAEQVVHLQAEQEQESRIKRVGAEKDGQDNDDDDVSLCAHLEASAVRG